MEELKRYVSSEFVALLRLDRIWSLRENSNVCKVFTSSKYDLFTCTIHICCILSFGL